jgi:hypothetical protein
VVKQTPDTTNTVVVDGDDDRTPIQARDERTPQEIAGSELDLAGILEELREFDQLDPPDYDNRYPMVLLAVTAAWFCGYQAGFRIEPAEPEWPVAYIELPTGQVSWHLPQHPVAYDLHSTSEKYRRVGAFIDARLVADGLRD